MYFSKLFLLVTYSLCISDLEILNAFYKSTNGKNWTNNEGWENNDVCNRFGVRCDNTGRVSTLYLHKNNLRGQFPDNFGYLTHLAGLDLSGNHISGPFPKSMANMKNLQAMFDLFI